MSVTLSAEGRRSVLEAFSRALEREAHNLAWWPELLWQQLYNGLQWEDEQVRAILAGELGPRSVAGARPWIRTRSPLRESRALIRTLTGHTSFVNACAVSPDGGYIVSAGDDGTLKLWDPASGRELRTLKFSQVEHIRAVSSWQPTQDHRNVCILESTACSGDINPGTR